VRPAAEGKSEAEAKGSLDTDAMAKRRAAQGKAPKPMWALTEDKAAEAVVEAEEDELDGLLDFAKNLGALRPCAPPNREVRFAVTACLLPVFPDFDKYIGDMEIATMLDTVKKRIEELEAVATDEDYERFEQRGQSRPQTMLTMAALEKKYGKADDEEKGNDETRSVAMSALSENRFVLSASTNRPQDAFLPPYASCVPILFRSRELGAIHSRKSVSVLAASAAAKKAAIAPFALDMPVRCRVSLLCPVRRKRDCEGKGRSMERRPFPPHCLSLFHRITFHLSVLSVCAESGDRCCPAGDYRAH